MDSPIKEVIRTQLRLVYTLTFITHCKQEKRREEKSKRISIVIIIPYSLFLIPRAFRLSSIIISVEKSKLGERGHNKCCSVTTYEGEDINIY